MANVVKGMRCLTRSGTEVPANVPVVNIAAGDARPKAGDMVYAATFEQPNGQLETNKICVVSGPTPSEAKQ